MISFPVSVYNTNKMVTVGVSHWYSS